MRSVTPDEAVKIFGALILLSSLCLPISSCTSHKEVDGMSIEVTESRYALQEFSPVDAASWLNLAAFCWPALAVATLHRRRAGPIPWIVRVLEPALFVATIWWTYMLASLFATEWQVGFYVAMIGLVNYGFGTVWSSWNWLNARRYRRDRNGA